MKKLLFTATFLFTAYVNAQVGIGTNTPEITAVLDLASTSKGFLIPRMTTAQRVAIVAPAKGLEVFDTTTNSQWFHNGTVWVNTAQKWTDGSISNSITNVNSGNVGIGTTAPSRKLDVVGTFKLTDGTQGVNKILISDTSGNTSWTKIASVPTTTPLVFAASGSETTGIANNTLYTLPIDILGFSNGDYVSQVGNSVKILVAGTYLIEIDVSAIPQVTPLKAAFFGTRILKNGVLVRTGNNATIPAVDASSTLGTKFSNTTTYIGTFAANDLISFISRTYGTDYLTSFQVESAVITRLH